MKPKPHLHLAPMRRLAMTFALKQALAILQMPQLELSEWLYEQIEKNPLLELDPTTRKSGALRESAASITLNEHLIDQIRDHFSDPEDQQAAFRLMYQLDEKGFLPKEIPNTDVLTLLQTLDPPGIFARDLQESFLMQLRAKGKGNTLAYLLVEQCYKEFLHGRFALIKKRLKTDEIQGAIRELSLLKLRPASAFHHEPLQPIIPDLKIEKIEGAWTLQLSEEDLPSFHIQEDYLCALCENQEEMQLLRSFKTEAKWIVRSLSRRRTLLQNIGRLLLLKQASYLEQKGPLARFTMAEMAEKLNIHESTLSRALFGKYVATPRGIIPLKALMTSPIESLHAKEMLEKLIACEDKKKPLTDDQLMKEIQKAGIPIARRTIAKYRTKLKIGPASKRKRTQRH